MIAVSNSMPLIALAKIDRLGLLKDYFSEIFIPEEVYGDVVRRGGNLAGSAEVAACSWIKVEQVKTAWQWRHSVFLWIKGKRRPSCFPGR